MTMFRTTASRRPSGGAGGLGDSPGGAQPPSTRKSFPSECSAILMLLKGNKRCFDCGWSGEHGLGSSDSSSKLSLGSEVYTNLPYASVAYGTLLCEKCACRHMTRAKDDSMIKSLEDGDWGLQNVITMLEGGNGNMLDFVLIRQPKRRRSSVFQERKGTFLGGPGVIEDEDFDASFDSRYTKSKAVASYRRKLSKRVANVVAMMASGSNENKLDIGQGVKSPLTAEKEEQQSLPPRDQDQDQDHNVDPFDTAYNGESNATAEVVVDDFGWQQNWSQFRESVSAATACQDQDSESYDRFDESLDSYDTRSQQSRGSNIWGRPGSDGYSRNVAESAQRILAVQEKIRRKREDMNRGKAGNANQAPPRRMDSFHDSFSALSDVSQLTTDFGAFDPRSSLRSSMRRNESQYGSQLAGGQWSFPARERFGNGRPFWMRMLSSLFGMNRQQIGYQ